MNGRLNLVHGVWLASSDIAMLAQSLACGLGTGTEEKPKSATAAWRRSSICMMCRHSRIALCCQNDSCAETQNIFVAMRMLCLLPAVTAHEPHLINAAFSLRAATPLAHAQASPPLRPGRRAEGRHGGGPDDFRSQRAGLRATEQRGAADRLRGGRPRRSKPFWWPAGRSSATADLSPWTRRHSRRRLPNCRRACDARSRRSRKKAPTSFRRRYEKAIGRPARWSTGLEEEKSAQKNASQR